MLKVWLAEFYLAVDRLFRMVHTGILALFEGFWMGILPDSVTDQISERSYRSGFPFNTPPYLNKGLQIWEEFAVKRYFAPGGRVLVAAAGSGREMIALAGAGFEVDGFDCNRTLGRASVLTSRIANAVRRLTLRSPVVDGGAAFPGRPKHYFRKRQLEAELAVAVYRLLFPVPAESAAPIRKAQ